MFPHWHDQAQCRGLGDEQFFLLGADGDRVAPEIEAAQQKIKRSFCYQCPVARECLTSALTNGDSYGIFASTAQERREIRRRLRRSAREHELYDAETEPASI